MNPSRGSQQIPIGFCVWVCVRGAAPKPQPQNSSLSGGEWEFVCAYV
jgi:hypothetical protein